MPRRNHSQVNFNTGEISPRLYARSDYEKYGNALETATNLVLEPHGPCRKRNGTQFIKEVKDSTKQVKLIPFQFSATDSVLIEAGNLYFRFYTNSANIESGGSPVEIVTPWDDTEVQNLSWTQFGDTMYFAHPDFEPRKLVRTDNSTWTLSTLDAFPEATYEAGMLIDESVTLGATSGLGVSCTTGAAFWEEGDEGRQIFEVNGTGRASIVGYTSTTVVTIDILETFSGTSFSANDLKMDLSPVVDLTPSGTKVGSVISITSDEPGTGTARDAFRSDDVGKYILLNGGVCQILALTSASEVSCEVQKSLNSLDETGNWSLEEPAWDATRGYPRAVGLFEQRLVFGGTTQQPQTIWMSETGIFDGFGAGPDDEDAIEIELSSSQVNEIQWMATTRDLIVGTSGAEITVSGSSGPITPSNAEQRPRTYYGSDQQVTPTVGNEVIFKQGSERKIRTFYFDFDVDNYKGEDLNFLAEHITLDLLDEVAYAQEPDSVIYATTDTGDLLAGTYVRDQQVIGWSKWTTEGSFENVQTIRAGEQDQVWVCVNRTIDGGTKRYIELLVPGDGTNDIHGFSDSFLTLDSTGAPVTSITGLDHLEGEVVQVRVDGATHPDKTVSSGAITLDIASEVVVVGLEYTMTAKTLKPDFDVGQGTMQAQDTRWVRPYLRVNNSTSPTVNGQAIPTRSSGDNMDESVPLFTGDLEYSAIDWDATGQLTITDSQPLPVHLIGIFGTIEGNTK